MRDLSTVRAGLFVIVALAILIVASLWVAGAHFGGAQNDYEVLMKTAGGIRQRDRVRVSGMETGRVLATFTAEAAVWCCAVAPGGRTLVAGDAAGRIYVLDVIE